MPWSASIGGPAEQRGHGGGRSRGALSRRPGRAEGLGQSRRFRRRGARRLFRGRHQRQRADFRDGRRRARPVRDSFSPGGRAYGARPRDPAELRLRRVRLHRRLDDGVVCRRSVGAGARQAGSGRVVCALSGRGRFDGRRGNHPSRGRQPADLHLRGQRRAAARGGGADPQALRAAAAPAGVRGTRRSCSSTGWPA